MEAADTFVTDHSNLLDVHQLATLLCDSQTEADTTKFVIKQSLPENVKILDCTCEKPGMFFSILPILE